MRVVMHVGAHKTGTSLVQKYFRDRPDEVTVPMRIGQVSRTDGDLLVDWGQLLHSHPEGLRARIEEEIATDPSVVLFSHENTLGRPLVLDKPGLYPDAARNAEALAGICEGLDVVVAFYVRPVADYLESYYIQTVQEGAWHSFEAWWETVCGEPRWMPVVEALESAFGADRVVVGDFTEIAEGQDTFLANFMTRTGMPKPPVVHYEPIRNASFNPRGLEIARDINHHLLDDDERMLMRKFLQKHFSNRKEGRARPMPDDVRRQLEADSAAEYEALAARSAAALADPLEPAPVPGSRSRGRGILRRPA